jgi:23S rRNA pseudouridine2605 synthase
MRRRSSPTHPYQDDSRGPRIQKVLADADVGSRRACEDAVEEGRVTVNGHRIDGLPAWVNPEEDDIRVDGRRIRAAARNVYVMLFKPKGYLSTTSDPEGRPLAMDLVQHPSHARLFPVGRLDVDASGLMLLTNDGELANRLTHPRFEMFKGYEVMVSGRIDEGGLAALERALFPRGGATSDDGRPRLVILKRDTGRTLLYMEIREGVNREIRPVLGKLGHPVKKLRRVRMGPLQLKSLQVGEWRELNAKELKTLREHAFATPQERAARRLEAPRPAPKIKAPAPRAPRAPRGDERATRGGERATRGGERATRGGERSTRGGERATRGGKGSTRGGERSTRGGERETRGGKRAPRGYDSRSAARPSGRTPRERTTRKR